MNNDIEKRIEFLRREIKRHNDLYYNRGRPEITDADYDVLLQELKALERENPEYRPEGSPLKTIGAPVRSKYRKIEHLSPMLSLESIHEEEAARHFDFSCRKVIGECPGYVCEPKLDGLSVELVYENGVFKNGSTRGNGLVGEDVTDNLRGIRGVPEKLKGSNIPSIISLRGEVMMRISDFNDLNKKRIGAGMEPYANPRNVAAGSLRQLDRDRTSERKLEVYCYRVLYSSGNIPVKQLEALEFLSAMGLWPVPDFKLCRSIEDAIGYHHKMEEDRDLSDLEMDGIVIKVNDLFFQNKLGVRSTTPRWAAAYKFRPRKEVTIVEDIIVQVGRTGVVTPLALLKPVDVGGVTVSRATLHNMTRIDELGIKKKDLVKVERAGDVIPYVAEVVASQRTGREEEFKMPSHCPSCGTKLIREDVFFRCPAGLGCPAQIKESICHFASKEAADIEGLSSRTVELFFEKGVLRRISDIYDLSVDKLSGLEGWKEKKIQNLLNAVERSRKMSLERFLTGLGIRNVGRHTARIVAQHYGTFKELTEVDPEELMTIKDVGFETARFIKDFLEDEKNIQEIERLFSLGVELQSQEKPHTGKLDGKKIVFTGSLENMSRSKASEIAEKEGAVVVSGVTSETNLVVAGSAPGSKIAKAEKLGIRIVSEEEFMFLIDGK